MVGESEAPDTYFVNEAELGCSQSPLIIWNYFQAAVDINVIMTNTTRLWK